AHQGGEDIPLTVYGPPGLKEWIELTLKISGSHLNYPIHYVEVSHNMRYEVERFNVDTYLLDDTVDSYMYVFNEPEKLGKLDTGKLKSIGIEPGPLYKEIKDSETFSHGGITYETSDFLGDPIPGRKISIHGDTRVMTASRYLSLVDGSDLIQRELTFLEGEREKALMYVHLDRQSVLENFAQVDYTKVLFIHIRNRYGNNDIRRIKETLGNHVTIAHDYLEMTIPSISL